MADTIQSDDSHFAIEDDSHSASKYDSHSAIEDDPALRFLRDREMKRITNAGLGPFQQHAAREWKSFFRSQPTGYWTTGYWKACDPRLDAFPDDTFVVPTYRPHWLNQIASIFDMYFFGNSLLQSLLVHWADDDYPGRYGFATRDGQLAAILIGRRFVEPDFFFEHQVRQVAQDILFAMCHLYVNLHFCSCNVRRTSDEEEEDRFGNLKAEFMYLASIEFDKVFASMG